MTQTGITLLLAIVILLIIILWAIWWQWEYRHNAFIRARKEIYRAIGEQDPYDVTRVLMLGDEEDNRLLCRSWSLSDGSEYWFGQWWFNEQCNMLCVPHALQTTTKKQLLRQNDWQKALAAIVRSRAQRPLDALVITLPLEALREGPEHPTTANLLRNCQQIQRVCGLSLPIYLLISGMETQEGMMALWEKLPQTLIGSSIPVARETVWKPQWLDDALDNTRASLRRAITELGTLEGETRSELFRLPEFFPQLAAPLHDLFDTLLSSNARDEPPMLRGIWFVARGSRDDKATMHFCHSLLTGKIAAESGLALPVRRLLRLNLRRHFITLACYSAVCLLWLVLMIWFWQTRHTNALLLHDRLQILATQTAASDTSGERTTAMYWRILNAIPEWQFRSPVWPGSYISRTDNKLRDTFQNATLASLLAPATDSICLQSEATARGENFRERDDILPEERYRQLEQLLARTKQMEQRYLPLLQLIQVKQPTVQTLATLSSTVWGVSVDTNSLPSQRNINELLASLNLSRLSLPDAATLTQRNSEIFARETQRWLEQNYDNAGLESDIGQLEQLLAQFNSGSDINVAFVRTLVRQVNRLQTSLTLLNNLSGDAAHSPIRLPLNELLSQARTLRLIDNKVIQDLLRHEALLRQRFLMQVEGSQLHFSALTEQSAEGVFTLSPDILALQKSLRDLLNQPFWQRSVGHTLPTVSGYPGNLQLQQTNALVGGYQRYIQQLPDNLWQPKIAMLAQNALARAMLIALYTDAPPTVQGNAINPDIADPVIDAFSQINRPQLAAALRQQTATQVIARIQREGSVLLPAASPPGISYATPEQAQASAEKAAGWVTAQTEQITAALTRYQPEISWLERQRPWLSLQDNALVARWSSSLNALQRLQQQDPTSPPVQMTTLAAALPEMTAENCQSELAQYVSAGNDFYSQSLTALVGSSQQKCRQLREQATISATQHIFTLYNGWLAGHFPFTTRLQAPDADPDRVKELVTLLGQLPKESPGTLPPLIQQLAAAQPLLAALVSPEGVTVRVLWRTSRDKEHGAEQIADWRLSGPLQSSSYPSGTKQDLHWRSGDSLSFSLRWAANSPWRPLPGLAQPGMTINGDSGLWRWPGSWSLLRMIAQQRVGGTLTQPLPLRFTLPIGDGQQRTQATVNLQLVLLGGADNAPLPWVNLAEQAQSGEHNGKN